MSILKQAGREMLALFTVSAITALATWALHPGAPQWKQQVAQDPLGISLNSVGQSSTPVLWVDARALERFKESHIPGAIPLNEDLWDEQLVGFLDHWKPGVTVVVYCSAETCQVSKTVAHRLRDELAIDAVFFLEGGWEAWQREGL